MGQAITKCIDPDAADGNAARPVDRDLLQPKGLYEKQAEHFKSRKVKKHIKNGDIAPFYHPKETDPQMELEDCNICYNFYPALNRCRCSMGICTECYLEMTRHNYVYPCPFCQEPLATTFNGPLSPKEKLAAKQKRQASEAAATRSRQVEQEREGSQFGQPSNSVEEELVEEKSVQGEKPAGMPENHTDAMHHLSREGMHEFRQQPVFDEDIQPYPKLRVDVHATSGSSSSQQSERDDVGMFLGSEPKGGGGGLSSLPFPPNTQPMVGMVFCRYNSMPLPPLFAMLAAVSGSHVPDGEQPDAAVASDEDSRNPAEAPSAHASNTAESSVARSTAISPGTTGAADASDKGAGDEMTMCDALENAGSCTDQHACSTSSIVEEGSHDVDMAAEQSRMEGSQQQSSSEELERKSESADELPSAISLHFGINEPVLMENPDGSKVFVLLSDEKAAKEQEALKRKEEAAAAKAAAKAATYWAPSDDHDAAVLEAIEQEDAVVRQRIAQHIRSLDHTDTSTPSFPAETSSSREQVPVAEDSFMARCRAADEALTAIINRRDAEIAAHAAAGQP